MDIVWEAGDKIMMMESTEHTLSFELKFYVHAAPDEVMELLTNADFIRDWSGAGAQIEKKVGGQFMMFDGWVKGNVLSVEERELSYTWKPSEWTSATPASVVKYRLEEAEHGTTVHLEHSGFPNEEEMENHKVGWEEHFFGPIGEYLANRNL